MSKKTQKFEDLYFSDNGAIIPDYGALSLRPVQKITAAEIERFLAFRESFWAKSIKKGSPHKKEFDATALQEASRLEIHRTMKKMKIEGHPKPSYMAVMCYDESKCEIDAINGVLLKNHEEKKRHVKIDIHVGHGDHTDFYQDSVFESRGAEEYSFLPLSNDIESIRSVIWLNAEDAYRQALEFYHQKRLNEASESSTLPKGRGAWTTPKKLAAPREKIRRTVANRKKLVSLAEDLSKFVASLPFVLTSSADISAVSNVKVLTTSEDVMTCWEEPWVRVAATFRVKFGKKIKEHEVVWTARDDDELPSLEFMKYEIMIWAALTRQETKAEKIGTYSGPILLAPRAAGVFAHEIMGHRLEAARLLTTEEGGSLGEIGGRGGNGLPVLHEDLVFFDDPNEKTHQGVSLIGAYPSDEEGVPPQKAVLIEDGKIKDFLSSRFSIKKRGHKSNGHARSDAWGKPTSRMGNTFLIPKQEGMGLYWEELKEKLLTVIREKGLPYGIIILSAQNGETTVSRFEIQAFRCEVDAMMRIWNDGAVDFPEALDVAGTPLASISGIIHYGKYTSFENGFCGADSGFVPVGLVSVSLLMNNIELQSKAPGDTVPFIIQSPKNDAT